MDLTKYTPILIAVLVVLIAIAAHYFIPGTPAETAIDEAAEVVVKDETGFSIPLPADNSTTIVPKSS